MIAAEQYRSGFNQGKYQMPFTDIAGERDDDFFIKCAEHFYALYLTGRTLTGTGGMTHHGRTVAELRAYGAGLQSPLKYLKALGKGPQDERAENHMNISHQPLMVLPKFIDIALSKIKEVGHDPHVRAYDTVAQQEREHQRNLDLLATMPQSKDLFAVAGRQAQGLTQPIASMTPDSVRMFEQLGGYVLADEIAMRDVLKATLSMSGYEELRAMFAEDMVKLGMASYDIRFDQGTKRVGIHYIDPAKLVMPPSAHRDHRDASWAAYLESVSISALRSEGMDEKTLYLLAKQYSGTQVNKPMFDAMPGWMNRGYREEYHERFRHYPYDSCQVLVMRFALICGDTERFVIGNRSDGARIFDHVSPTAQLDRRDVQRGKSLQDRIVQRTYRGSWCVGSKTVWGCGPSEVQVRTGPNGQKKSMLPIGCYSLQAPSMVGRCISVVDDLELAVHRVRDEITRFVPSPNVVIDLALLRNTTRIGRQDFSPADLLKMAPMTGVLFVDSQSEFGLPGEGSNRPPVTPLPNNLVQNLQALYIQMDRSLNLIRTMTGLNEVADGSSNPQDMLNGVANMLSAASNSALGTYFEAMRSIFSRQVELVGRSYQNATALGDIEIDNVPTGLGSHSVIRLDSSFLLREMEFSCRPAPSAEARQLLMAQLAQRQQEGAISQAAYLSVWAMVQDGDIQKAQYFLAQYCEEQRARNEKQQSDAIAAQAKANQTSAAMAEQAKQATLEKESELRIKEMRAEYGLKQELSRAEATSNVLGEHARQSMALVAGAA